MEINVYNQNNIFAKILRGEIPCTKVYEDDYTLAFEDINPSAKIHILIIPKGEYSNFTDLLDANSDFMTNFMLGVKKAIKAVNVENKDYKLLTNNGSNAGQEVFHMHFHVLIN